MERKLLTVDELAEGLRTTTGTVYGWVSLGRIPKECVVRIGRKLLFNAENVNNWIGATIF